MVVICVLYRFIKNVFCFFFYELNVTNTSVWPSGNARKRIHWQHFITDDAILEGKVNLSVKSKTKVLQKLHIKGMRLSLSAKNKLAFTGQSAVQSGRRQSNTGSDITSECCTVDVIASRPER